MSTVIKQFMPVKPEYVKSKRDGTAFLRLHKSNYIPDIYSLTNDEARLVDCYLDDTFQWVRLTDGRRLRTRELKRNFKNYMPQTLREAVSPIKGVRTRQLGIRVLALDNHYKHRVGYIHLSKDSNRLYVKHVVNGVESDMYIDIHNPHLFDPTIDLVKDYQMAIRRSKFHSMYYEAFITNLMKLIDGYVNYNVLPK